MSQASKKKIKEANIELKKSLGQNFLNDINIVKKIVNVAQLNEDISVIEIGPGIGALTQEMLKLANQVIAIEIDTRLIPILQDAFESRNFKILNEDFLKIDPKLVKSLITKKKVKVVANLPYYITTAIINRIFSEFNFVDELYIMVQKEVAQRICAVPKTKKYGSLSVFCQTMSDVKYEFTVKRTVFNPPPNVDSAIISFKKKKPKINMYLFDKFIRNCFTQKRKTLVNNLHVSYKIDKDILINFLEVNSFTKNVRAEEISITQFKSLFLQFNGKFCTQNS